MSQSYSMSHSFDSEQFMSATSEEDNKEVVKNNIWDKLIVRINQNYTSAKRQVWYHRLAKKLRIPVDHIISHKSKKKNIWDIFILLLALTNAIAVPVEMAFQPSITQSWIYILFSYLSDVMYLLDMAFMCITSYLDRKGHEILNSNQIILRYISSSLFFSDIFALLGSKTVSKSRESLRVFGFFKVIRIL